MKAKVTPKHAGSPDPGPWLAQLHHGNGDPDPADAVLMAAEAGLTRPYVGLAGGAVAAGDLAGSGQPAHVVVPGPALSPEDGTGPREWHGNGPEEPPGSGEARSPAPGAPGQGTWAAPRPLSPPVTCRAVIGDELRRPALWCQLGACVARYADPEAIGEADNRARAVAAGWREDALGRFACPSCLQRSAEFRVRYPVVPWDTKRAVAMAILMTVAARRYDASGPAGWRG